MNISSEIALRRMQQDLSNDLRKKIYVIVLRF